MAKGTKKIPKKRAKSTHSRLKDHKKEGRKLLPPLLAVAGDKLRTVSWAQVHLPNYLWICSHLELSGGQDLLRMAKFLDYFEEVVGNDRTDFPENWILSGSLIAFEAIPTLVRPTILQRLQDDGTYEDLVTEEFAHMLGMYGPCPGSWLLEPWIQKGMKFDQAKAKAHLDRVITVSHNGGDTVPTRVKMIDFRQRLKAGKISLPRSESIEELMNALGRYPNKTSDTESVQVESFIRASFNLFFDQPTEWAQAFWRANWRLYKCEWPNYSESQVESSDEVRAKFLEILEENRKKVKELWDHFFEIAKRTDPDLYDPARYEVLTGQVGRLLRYLINFVDHPRFWTVEHGAPILRATIETQIVFKYLLKKEGADPLYQRFKSYGLGRLKLRKLHFDEYVQSMENPPPSFVEYLEYLESVVNREVFEEFQDIDLGNSFSGVDIRKMASEVDMESDYRMTFALASSNLHGEWSVLDEFVFVPCMNPTHRGHRILGDPLMTSIDPQFMDGIMNRVDDLVNWYSEAIEKKSS